MVSLATPRMLPMPNTPVARRFSELSAAAVAIWAKSGEPNGHGLLAHVLDVAAVAERLLARESPATLAWAASVFGLSIETASRALAALVGLHDIGKAIPGFQAKWPEGKQADMAAGLPFNSALEQHHLHDIASAVELAKLLPQFVGSPGRARALAGAVAAHHGYVFDSGLLEKARRPGEPSAWVDVRQEIFDAYWRTLQPAVAGATTPELPVLTWLAGLTSVSDWIGSNTDWFKPCQRDDNLVQHHACALTLADIALDEIGWPQHGALLRRDSSTDDLVATIVGDASLSARPLQSAGDRLLRTVAEPVLLIVEAPMGEGKTELAFLAHLRLQAALGHRGLYIGLPTQATGNAMFDRTLAFLRAFGHESRLDIQLAHGGAALQDERLVALRGIHGVDGDTVRSSAWFSQRRRPLLSPYGVGTIDQVLLAGLNVKHHFVRLWGLANRVVVLDEIHAYDTYTSTLIEGVLRWLKALRCSVVLMSATLPRSKRDGLLAAWGASSAAALDLPYPRVLIADGALPRGEHFSSRPQASIELAGVEEDLDRIADLAASLARCGGCGAVVVNTVDRAQQLYLRLRDRLAGLLEPMLFHARFPADERSLRERAVLATFGRDAARPSAALLIATQVVEQSLDIDFDFLISDLAPVDLLLQRAGRLHRHERERPAAHREPRLVVAGLLADRAPDLKTTAWGAIYDEWILYRTWAITSRELRWQLPRDIDRMVQLVYEGGELPPGLAPDVVRLIEGRAEGHHLAETQHERQLGRNAILEARAEFEDAYSGKPRGSDEGDFPGVRNVTRLGPESLIVVPVHVVGDRWRVALDGDSFDPGKAIASSTAQQLVARQVRLSRRELVRALKTEPQSVAFSEHPWLKHCVAMPLVDGVCVLNSLTVTLDPQLGIVYSKSQGSPNVTQRKGELA